MPYKDPEKRKAHNREYKRLWMRERNGYKARVPFPQRFWDKVEKTDGCWLWRGSRRGKYGQISVRYKNRSAHTVSYELLHGPIPAGMVVRHQCDNRLCVRPDHLLLGTNQDNHDDMVSRGRSLKGDRNPSRQHPEHLRRGSQCRQAKLTELDVMEIRRLLCEGKSFASVAREFNVSKPTICGIKVGRTWRSVQAGGVAER